MTPELEAEIREADARMTREVFNNPWINHRRVLLKEVDRLRALLLQPCDNCGSALYGIPAAGADSIDVPQSEREAK
jgi:hypothetical protein